MSSRAIIQESLPLYVERKDWLAAVKNFKCKQSYLRVGGRDPSPLPSYPQCVAGIHPKGNPDGCPIKNVGHDADEDGFPIKNVGHDSDGDGLPIHFILIPSTSTG
jgi:hypothetical protein